MPLTLPMFALVGAKPVRLTKTPEGGMAVESWDFRARKFRPDPTMMSRVLFSRGEEDIKILSAADFAHYTK